MVQTISCREIKTLLRSPFTGAKKALDEILEMEVP